MEEKVEASKNLGMELKMVLDKYFENENSSLSNLIVQESIKKGRLIISFDYQEENI